MLRFCKQTSVPRVNSHVFFQRYQSSLPASSDIESGTRDGKSHELLNELNSELENRNQEDEQPAMRQNRYTILLTGTFQQKKLPPYLSLRKFNDPAYEVPKLSSNLESILTSPGVHFLKDPRTNMFNFDKSFAKLPHIDDLNMEKIHSFTPSSRDTKLLEIVQNLDSPDKRKNIRQTKYYSSTSSMTGVLMKFHLLLSNSRPINTTTFSKFFPETAKFSGSASGPTSIVVSPKSTNVFSIDADRSTDSEITLSVLGNALELMLTKEPRDFKNYLKNSKVDVPEEKSSYHYAKIGRFTIRSQLDAFSKRLPGTGTFDIKTRAVCAIRFDLSHTDYFPTNYDIVKEHGLFESFERELYDAARIVMFKYSLQARLGNMDGIFMAFHNIKRFLGFKYLPLTEIDNYFFGDYKINGKRYGDNLLRRIPQPSFDRTDDTLDKDVKKAAWKNQEVLNDIVDDLGNYYQDKREALSTYIADHEMRFSIALFQKLLDTANRDTEGKPYRVILKRVPKSRLVSRNPENSEDNESIEKSDSSLKEGDEPDLEVSKNRKEREGRTVSDYQLIAIVNTLEPNEHEQLQMLADERLKKSVEEVKEMQDTASLKNPSSRIKLFHEFTEDYSKKFQKLNDSILNNSEKNGGFHVYQLGARHIFDGVLCEDKYPTPPLSALDPNSNFTWDVEFSISKLNRDSDKHFLYSKLVSNIASQAFKKESDFDTDVYANGNVLHTASATELQNITRAYSQKAVKRHDLFLKRNLKRRN